MNYPVDLHTHSVRSDGNDTVQELIELAAKQGTGQLRSPTTISVPLRAYW